jgi:hypothetical protein
MNRIAKGVILVLASGWFVPVSCSTATAVLAQVSASNSERPWTPDQRPGRFRIVARPGEGNAPFRVLTLADLPELKAKPAQHTFLLEPDSGRIDNDQLHERVTYRVLARTPAGQEIEVVHEDGDDQSFSRYRATATDIDPISTRYGPVSRGIVISALVNGFVVAFAIYVLARILKFLLRKRLAPPPAPQL